MRFLKEVVEFKVEVISLNQGDQRRSSSQGQCEGDEVLGLSWKELKFNLLRRPRNKDQLTAAQTVVATGGRSCKR